MAVLVLVFFDGKLLVQLTSNINYCECFPLEWAFSGYYENPDLLAIHECKTIEELQAKIWEETTTPNGVIGAKTGIAEPQFSQMIANLQKHIPGGESLSPPEILNVLFPNWRIQRFRDLDL